MQMFLHGVRYATRHADFTIIAIFADAGQSCIMVVVAIQTLVVGIENVRASGRSAWTQMIERSVDIRDFIKSCCGEFDVC
jgi:hypothetical protein